MHGGGGGIAVCQQSRSHDVSRAILNVGEIPYSGMLLILLSVRVSCRTNDIALLIIVLRNGTGL